ncbi:SusC/RagA family TonB-linked outer membrane protein [Sphingobacterium sp. SGG-5]|uniref:SusC/RagA family TonB-linked outer membrane protein n=1 Tax=Sphingobacterium sp. SGG-5 TaxID=2710881 RepID=UPI0013EB08F1|nr:SusC/RagA family TonB-linked outer membrane protein [Sphingobacterium sp. SGG-5]NGM61331.1 SusC/RagA family TonB-linked outer membrane protein [Sphingobacterium sp. SGG-5]
MNHRFLTQILKTTCLLATLLVLVDYPLLASAQPIARVKISLSVTGLSLETVFTQLEKQSGYTFLYKKEEVKNLRSGKLDVKDQSLDLVLAQLFKSTGLRYEIDDKVIIVRKAETQNRKTNALNSQQERIIKGRVLNDSGVPLAGATIYVKEAPGSVAQTGDQGRYEITIPSSLTSPVLVFSYVGMVAREVTLGTQNIVDVQLAPADNILEETVIVGGYGTIQKRMDMVGSAFQVNSEQIKNLPAQRVDKMLEGLVPGLQVDFNTDQASSTRPRMNLRVRGTASLSASNEPLWIVDGIRVFTGDRTNMIPGMNTAVSPLSYLNPDDIESITVLKDATMASIYGADGANGVILITTKKGTKSAPSLSVTSRYGLAQINNSTRFKVLDAEQYMELARESYLNVPSNNMAFFPYQDLPNNAYSATNTDWYDVYYGTGIYSQNNINIRGGTEAVDYFVSGEYFTNQSTIKGNQQDRFSLRSNIDFKITDKLNLGLQMSGSYNVNDIFNPSTDFYATLPILAPYNEDGSMRLWYDRILPLQDATTGDFVPSVVSRKFFNSVAEREENDYVQRGFYSVNNLLLDYQIVPGLKFTSQLGANIQSSHEEMYQARSNWSGISLQGEPRGYATRAHANFLLWSVIERLNYNRQFGKHGVTALLGFEASSQDNKSLSAYGNGFANDHIKEISYAAVRENGSSSSNRVRRSSFFGQGGYNYDSKYYLNLNWRSDGNSDFGEDSQWGNFWSIGSSWNIHNEDFFQSDLLKVLKLKASYGTLGNSRLGNLRAQGLYTYGTSSNYAGQSGSTMASVWNRKLSWEQSYMTNIGLRANFGNRVDVDVDVYYKKTVDLLQEQDVSRTTGDTRVSRNIGSTQNRGIEMNIETINIQRKDFSWRTTANISRNENKLLELYQGIPQTRDRTIWMEGYDLGTYFLVQWAGVDPRDGAPLWYDINGNVTRTYNNANRVPNKNSTPWFYGGLTNTFQYKDWTLSFLAVYSAGGYQFTSFGRDASSDGLNLMESNQSVNQLDRWQKPGDLALSPKPLWQLTNASSTMNSTRYLQNASSIRLKNIYLTYELSETWTQRIGLKGASVSLLADNLGVWTPYDKADRNSYKQTMSGYPMETTVSAGLNIKL